MKIATVVGARPQFIKLALFSRQLRVKHSEILIHTGQHYDSNLSGVFFKELHIPKPDYNLNVGSYGQGEQTARMLMGIEVILLKEKPDIVIVYGDTNSTLAGALAAAKLNIPIAHIESGLRSYRKDMPEEINRILTDHISSFLFCPTMSAVKNLRKEGIVKGVYNVGDVMYDALVFYLKIAKKKSRILSKFGLCKGSYFLATIHRAENTNSEKKLKKIMDIFANLDMTVVFPVHPRTAKALKDFGLNKFGSNIMPVEPLNYFDMLILEANAKVILTDSGGIQKEAFFLNVPCLTLREETEWLETVSGGGNKVVGIEKHNVIKEINKFDKIKLKNNMIPFGGMACRKIIRILEGNSIFNI